MQDREKIIQTAKKCWEKGLNAVPCSDHKTPVGKWEFLHDRLISEQEFNEKLNGHAYGLGIICGRGSGNLEVIDVDHKNDPKPVKTLSNDFVELIEEHNPELLRKLVIVCTPTGGLHLYYRCDTVKKNTKLARRYATPEELEAKPGEKVKVLIETRGLGGFVVCPPTPGYTMAENPGIHTISPDERECLLSLAGSFNEIIEQHIPVRNDREKTDSVFELTPWEDYDEKADLVALLENHNYTIHHKNTERTYLTRPGKDKRIGYSGDVNHTLKLWKCFSSSDSNFETERAYRASAVFAILECGGDFSASCKKLESMGYGKRKPAEIKQLPAVKPISPDEPAPDLFKHVYIPNPDNRPAQLPPIIELDGTGILTQQNIGAIIANPGGGKSSAMEAIIAAMINPNCDTLGFSVFPDCRGILYIDNERTNTDVWNSYYRAHRRTGKKLGEDIGNITIAGLRSISRLQDRRDIITTLIIDKKPGLVLIDGAGDLVNDTNKQEEATECKVWLRSLTATYNLSLFVTLHPNPNSVKPRGHQGSEICREAESVLLIKNYDNDTKLLTTDFEHGKNRNNPKLTTAFRWSAEHSMFMSVDFENVEKEKQDRKHHAKRGELLELARAVLAPPKSMKRVDLIGVICDFEDTSVETAKRRIKAMVELTLIKKGEDGNYRMIIN